MPTTKSLPPPLAQPTSIINTLNDSSPTIHSKNDSTVHLSPTAAAFAYGFDVDNEAASDNHDGRAIHGESHVPTISSNDFHPTTDDPGYDYENEPAPTYENDCDAHYDHFCGYDDDCGYNDDRYDDIDPKPPPDW